SIGVIQGYAWTSYLTAQKFSNLEVVTDRRQNPKKLRVGHIQAFVGWKNAWKNDTEEAGINPDEFETNYAFESIQLYIAFSKKTDQATVDAWQKVLRDMQKDGSFLKIMQKWLPEFKMPGAERPGAI
ncbi:MAG TPA: transporter substrate-binding domain-containing protein, partial [Aquabacterium sp.]|nr:transporter substrate-binding domain-containing protein [Aquabacterium sp.]